MALCLCCGARYPVDGDCPYYLRRPHSIGIALEVSRYLHEHGIETPRPLDVQQARAALEARGRV